MPLSTVIIADDDYLVIEDLKKTIPWRELGYLVVGTATNGLDALRLVQKYQPDLLITDIIMPSMTGLRLIELVRKRYSDMQILIISSYDEFEYAKSAIAHGVADYILKTQITPMSFSQRLIELSNTAIVKKRRNQAALRQSMQDYFNDRHVEPISEKSDPLLYAISLYKYYFIVIGVHRPFTTSKETLDRITYESTAEIDDVIASKFTDCSIPIRFIFHSFLILGFVSTRETRRQTYSSIQNIIAKLRSILDTSIARSVSMFIDASPCTLSEFRQNYFQLQPLMMYHSGFSRNSNVSWKELWAQAHVPAREDFPFANFHWPSPKPASELEQLDRYMLKLIEGRDIGALHRLYWMLLTWLRSNSPEDASALNGCYYFSDPQMLISHVHGLLRAHSDSMERSAAKSIPLVVEKGMQYIREHFSDHTISVQSIADAVNVSSGRLGVLFRKSLGKSINEYLTDVRIEHAIYLLENTSLKIYEVADRSGFNVSHYFSDIMYKKTGKRPIDYKRLPPRE